MMIGRGWGGDVELAKRDSDEQRGGKQLRGALLKSRASEEKDLCF